MSAFAKRSFDAVVYAASRPSYPPALFKLVLAYLDQGQPTATLPRTLLDLGCGPGLSTFDWLEHDRFQQIVGIDPSSNMVSAANDILRERRAAGRISPKVDLRFQVARADRLQGVVEEQAVDLVVAGQAAHWFDADATYAELARVLKPGGAFAFWGYGEFYFPTRPELSALIPPYSAETLGSYWEQPGRSIVEALLTPFPFPSSSAGFDPDSYTRSFFLREPSSSQEPLPFSIEGLPRDATAGEFAVRERKTATDPARVLLSRSGSLLTRQWTMNQLIGYLRTWSARHAYQEQNPAAPDVIDAFVEQLREAGLRLDERKGETIEVAWDVGLIMGRKK